MLHSVSMCQGLLFPFLRCLETAHTKETSEEIAPFDDPVITITCPTRIAWHNPQATRGWSCESFLSSQRWCSLLSPGQRQLLWRRRCNRKALSLRPRTRSGQHRSRLHKRQNDAAVFRRRDFVPKFWFSRFDPSGTPSPDTPAARIQEPTS